MTHHELTRDNFHITAFSKFALSSEGSNAFSQNGQLFDEEMGKSIGNETLTKVYRKSI